MCVFPVQKLVQNPTKLIINKKKFQFLHVFILDFEILIY